MTLKQVCESCNNKLPWFRFFNQTCVVCGTKYKAVKKKKFSYLSALVGIGVPLYLPFVIFVPLPMWVKLYLVPLLYVMLGLLLSIHLRMWVPVERSEKRPE